MYGEDFCHVNAQNTYFIMDLIIDKLHQEQEKHIKLGKKFNAVNPRLIFKYSSISEYFHAVKAYPIDWPILTHNFEVYN